MHASESVLVAPSPTGASEPGTLRVGDTGRHAATPYADALERHASRSPIQLMVPGHSGNGSGISGRLADYFGERVLQLDVPMLLDDIDLGENSPLSQALELAAEAWGARRTWFLAGGASQANRIAALAVRGLGANVLSQRSAHSSFSDGVLTAGLTPSFVLPSVDARYGIAHGVSPSALDDALTAAADRGQPASAVYIVSPSYFGSVADVAGLAEVAHAHGAPLIVDGAWGPHFGFHPDLPESPTRLGADLVVSSTHKLAGSLTQSAMLHLGDGPFADRLEPLIERAVSTTSSTSSSALLTASLDIARHTLMTGADAIGRSIAGADAFRAALREDPRFSVVSYGFGAFDDIVGADPLRVPIDVSATGVSGHWLRQHLLEVEGIYFEISTATALVALIGAGKTPDLAHVHRVLSAAVDSEEAHAERAQADAAGFPPLPPSGALRMLPRDAYFAATELVPAAQAVGRISADTLAAYPPGIPNVIPGEEITEQTVAFLQAVAASPSGYVRGAVDSDVARFRVTGED
ncbi:aminotransferase class I/II-fold pyridoxal phosphate-dependent enzyme [Microbacterium azadirachtae]|uniref:aminotransferase class I/II-fold pyridoxal phosphate-dependent enzyme n=1 Tax=Microbacterium azadirachtae TaxID=582680 RepID=UPI000881D7AA|nr:amino acid decarboxylase [Microbacterium azadirachtae]SDL18296.1 Arginine/lysine/ornithine decarboxylase [Microbacterium azadirachtae]SEF48658.1 Arginine/lysine/ornithine decarboxylase [Microbacterium azadirachtae]SEF48716.1 Arginine/lysine/ornithine decarboxylase [Microbacterium azadirachtae]